MDEWEEIYSFNNETMEKIVTVRGRAATVKDHVVVALTELFEVHPDILAKLLWMKPQRKRKPSET